MRCIITGAGGLVGSALSKVMAARGVECLCLRKSDLDVTDSYAVNRKIEKEKPDIIFHCAAFTAVDGAESERVSAFSLNRDGALNVAVACRELGAQMVFFSTDYVFNGVKETPYSPQDEPAPLSTYGESMLAGENGISDSGVDALLIRTSWLYGATGRNFVQTVVQRAREGKALRVVDDQVGSPTWVRHLAEATLDLVDHNASGIYHLTNAGEGSWYEFAKEILALMDLEAEIEPISSRTLEAPALRPRYSVLDSSTSETLLGYGMTPWREALKKFLQEVVK